MFRGSRAGPPNFLGGNSILSEGLPPPFHQKQSTPNFVTQKPTTKQYTTSLSAFVVIKVTEFFVTGTRIKISVDGYNYLY